MEGCCMSALLISAAAGETVAQQSSYFWIVACNWCSGGSDTLFLTLAFRFSPGALPCGACTTFIPWKTGHSNGQDPAWFWRDSQNHDGEFSGRFHARSWLWLLYKVCWKVYFSSILGGRAFLSCFLRQKVKSTWSIKVPRTSLSIMSSFVLNWITFKLIKFNFYILISSNVYSMSVEVV